MRYKTHFLSAMLVMIFMVSVVSAGSSPVTGKLLKQSQEHEVADMSDRELRELRNANWEGESSPKYLASIRTGNRSSLSKGRSLEDFTARADSDPFEPLYSVDISFLTGSLAGTVPSNHSLRPFISGNGRYMVFTSMASNLVAGDTNGGADIFRLDLNTGDIINVTAGFEGGSGVNQFDPGWGANLNVWSVTCDYSGNKVCFTSSAALVGSDTNGTPDVYVADIAAGTFTRVSTATDGSQAPDTTALGAAWSFDGVISANGSRVAFVSESAFGNSADGNSAGAGAGFFDVFTKSLPSTLPGGDLASTLTMVSFEDGAPAGTSAANTGLKYETLSLRPWISGDGNLIVYDSTNPRIVNDAYAAAANSNHSCYVYNVAAGTNSRMDVRADGSVSPSADAEAAESFTSHISPDGKWVTFASRKTLDFEGVLAAGPAGGVAGGVVFARTVAWSGSIRSPQFLDDGTTFDPTFFFRLQSPTVDDQGNVTFWSFGNNTPSFTASSVVVKLFDAPAPAVTGDQIIASVDPAGPFEIVRQSTSYGDGFWNGAVDKSFHNAANNTVVYVHQSDFADPNFDIQGLKNIFMTQYDEGAAVATATVRLSNGDPSVDAHVALADPVFERRNHGLNYTPTISGNGQYVGFTTRAPNLFAEGDAGGSLDGGINNPYGAVVDVQNGTATLASVDDAGLYTDPLNFAFNLAPYRALARGDIFLFRTNANMVGGVSVSDNGDYAYQEISHFDNAGAIFPGTTSFITVGNVNNVGPFNSLLTTAAGDTELHSGPLRFQDNSTYMTPDGNFIAWSSDADSIVNAGQDIVAGGPTGAVFSPYRYDVGGDTFVHLGVGPVGVINSLGDVNIYGISDDGDDVLLFNADDPGFADNAPLTDVEEDGNLFWVRNVTAGQTRLASCNTSGDPAGFDNGTTIDTEFEETNLDLTSFIGDIDVAFAGDGGSFMWPGNYNNMVTGFDETTTNYYHKTLTGSGTTPDAGAVRVVNPAIGGAPTGDLDRPFGGAALNTDGTEAYYVSTTTNQTASDSNGTQQDILRRVNFGDATFASDNANSEQSVAGTATAPATASAGGFTWVAFLNDAGDISTTTVGGTSSAFGETSFGPNLYLKRFYDLGTPANSSWEMFE